MLSLKLDRNQFGDDGAAKLAELKAPFLTKLSLESVGISAKGARDLSRGDWVVLDELNLQRNRIGDDGLREIVEHFYGSLGVLDVS